jgi:hypothetical protein
MGVNPPKGKFLGTMTRPETDVVVFSYPLNQSDQVQCQLRLSRLIVNERWEQMHVHP